MLTYQMIQHPSKGVLRLLKSRVQGKECKEWIEAQKIDAVGLIQGQLASIIVAMDIAEKAANIRAAEVHGVCPQHITLIAVMGSTSAVSTAMAAVKDRF